MIMQQPVVDMSAAGKTMNPHFRYLVNDKHRKHVLVGGASSSKSYSTAQKIVYKMVVEKGHRYLVIRKVARTIKQSVFRQLLEIIRAWNLSALFKVNNTDYTITCKINGNEIIFAGVDDVEKLKSIQGITDIWAEEASELLETDYEQLNLRMRGKTPYHKQFILTLNPISIHHWIKKRFFDNTEPNCITDRSTYKDNVFLDQDSIEELESITDPYYKRVYVEGDWGVYGNVVFTNYIIEDFPYGEDDLENVSQGMDFGFAHASAIERCGFRDGELYVFDELYGRGWTNPEFMGACKDQWPQSQSWDITADSAEPDRIADFQNNGFRRIHPAKKGPGSLRFGIDYLNSVKIHIHATKCPNLARELPAFKRREDKDGEALDEFVQVKDDTIAALRYATEWIWSNADRTAVIPDYSLDDLGM